MTDKIAPFTGKLHMRSSATVVTEPPTHMDSSVFLRNYNYTANTEEKIVSAACVLAAILYRTKHKIRIYTPKVLKFDPKLQVRETVCWRH